MPNLTPSLVPDPDPRTPGGPHLRGCAGGLFCSICLPRFSLLANKREHKDKSQKIPFGHFGRTTGGYLVSVNSHQNAGFFSDHDLPLLASKREVQEVAGKIRSDTLLELLGDIGICRPLQDALTSEPIKTNNYSINQSINHLTNQQTDTNQQTNRHAPRTHVRFRHTRAMVRLSTTPCPRRRRQFACTSIRAKASCAIRGQGTDLGQVTTEHRWD